MGRTLAALACCCLAAAAARAADTPIAANDVAEEERSSPDLVATPGWLHAVWEDHRSGTAAVYYARRGRLEQLFRANHLVAPSVNAQRGPALAANCLGEMVVAWSERVDASTAHIYRSVSLDAGDTFSVPGAVRGTSEGQEEGVDLASRCLDTRYAVWRERVSGEDRVQFGRSLNGGQQFQAAQTLVSGEAEGVLSEPKLAVARDGTVYVAWWSMTAGGAVLHRRSDDGGGSFADAVEVAGSEDSIAAAPALAAWDGGNLWVGWVQPGGGGADLVQVSHSTDFGQTYTAPVSPSTGTGRSQRSPALVVDDFGTLYVVWTEATDDGAEVWSAFSTDGGAGFEVAERLDDAGADATDVVAVVDEYDQLAVAWRADRGSGASDILVGGLFELVPAQATWLALALWGALLVHVARSRSGR